MKIVEFTRSPAAPMIKGELDCRGRQQKEGGKRIHSVGRSQKHLQKKAGAEKAK